MEKYCGICGAKLKDGKCPKCNNKVEVVDDNTEVTSSNGMAIAGFVLSFFVSALGLVFSIIGLNKSKELNGKNRGLALAGIIISAVGIGLDFIAVIILLSFLYTIGSLY